MQALARSSCVCMLVLAPALAAGQPLTFGKSDYPSVTGARAIVTADFNRDGWMDVAHAGPGTNSVQVLLNARDGRLTHTMNVAVGAGPFAMATDDFNRDGVPDMAVANADGNAISILLGQGDGHFTRRDISTGTVRGPRGLTTADINRDGKPDVICTGYDGGAILILPGDGTGTFTAGSTLRGATHPHGVAIADFNHDGRLDLAVAQYAAEGLVVWFGSTGGFIRTPIAGKSKLNVLAIGDFNADGWMDIAAAGTYTGHVAIYRGGAAGLVYTRSYSVDADPRGLSIGDVNHDGALDVIVANRGTSTINVLRGDPAHPGSFLPRLTFPAGAGSRAVAVADFDNDGRSDLATGNQYAAAASILENTTHFRRAAYTFARATLPAQAALSQTGGFAGADFNRDGDLDFVHRIADSTDVAVVLSDGRTVVWPAPGPDASHVIGDFNGDGNVDVAYVGVNQGGLVTRLGNGRGSFMASPVTRLALNGPCGAGDMNQDGRLDLVCTGHSVVMLGNGDGTFREGPPLSASSPFVSTLADLDRDGRLDVVLGSGDVCFGDGTGAASCGHVDIGRLDAESVAVADLNHDGYLDLVFSDGKTDFAAILGGAAGYQDGIVWSFSEGLAERTDFAVADINADGHQDLVINSVGDNADTGGVMRVLPGLGDGTFGPAEAFSLAAGEILVADVTRDGLPDILAASGRQIDVLVNQRNDVNRPPKVTTHDVTSDRLGCITFPVEGIDLDQHALSVAWSGEVRPRGRIGTLSAATTCIDTPGTHQLQLTVSDNRGAVVSRMVTISVAGPKEIVLNMTAATAVGTGQWSIVSDPAAAGGVRAYNRNLGAPKVTVPAAQPASFVELSFVADPTEAYKLWVRLKADRNYWGNDSIWVQFSGSTDLSGRPKYRIGSTSGLSVNLEECANCGESGWGWEDDGWGSVNRNGVMLRFPDGGLQRIRIQTREDGVSVDQIVLSAAKYATARPGAVRNDVTILASSGGGSSFEVLVDFRCETTGCVPNGPLFQASDGWIYGTTSEASFFRMDRSGSLQLLSVPVSVGDFLILSFFEARDGFIYGYGGEEPNAIFRIDHAGVVTVIHQFDVGHLKRLVEASDGFFYGITCCDGAFGGGTVFRMDSSGDMMVLRSLETELLLTAFFQASDGFFYGTTCCNGAFGVGTVFRMDSSGAITVLRSLETELYPTEFFEAQDGLFYGTGSQGVVLRMDRSGAITVLHRFDSTLVSLVQASDGFFYGTASAGCCGEPNTGSVFRVNGAGDVTVLHSFDGSTGAYPYAGPIEASDGFLYGLTYSGGAFGFGTIYRMDRRGALTVLHSFDGAHGAGPAAALTEGDDGALYGTTAWGGAYGDGTVFRIVPPR
jgi:uncharacterized repeat protein (TIGR03803 family)